MQQSLGDYNLIPIFLEKTDLHVLQKLSNCTILSKPLNKVSQQAILELLEQGKINALSFLNRDKKNKEQDFFEENNLLLALKDLQKQLNLKKLPKRIECFDISHLSGQFVYGSMVVFIDGKPCKKFYKLFKCENQNDDYKNQASVLKRRLNKFIQKRENLPQKQSEWSLPDLIIIDGGKGQLSVCYQVLVELELQEEIDIVALAKKQEEIFTLDHLENI